MGSGSERGGALNDRELRILSLLVREYIDRGEPVSSLWLASHSGVHLSSATVRNILVGLEGSGYLHQPHTSAGRVPTDQGYRSYVDLLLQSRRPSRPALEVEARLRRSGTIEHVLADVSHELSRAAHHLAFALAPANEAVTLKHIEFVALDASRVLVVVIAGNGQVWHKAVSAGEQLSPSDLVQAANYLNREFVGSRLSEIREAILTRLQQDRVAYDALMARALALASDTFDEVAPEAHLFIHGASSLLEDAATETEVIPLDKLRALLAMIEEKHRLVRLLTEYIEGPGLTVVIGTEHASPDLRDFSLVAATYVEGGHRATVGLLGPRRMRYSRAIAAVDSVSQAVSRVLNNTGN
jgi:heat-inducible transcriptional repressor